jgi:hypothetical protein
MEQKAHHAEFGEHRDHQDSHDRQYGAKLGAFLSAWNENPPGSLKRSCVLGRNL